MARTWQMYVSEANGRDVHYAHMSAIALERQKAALLQRARPVMLNYELIFSRSFFEIGLFFTTSQTHPLRHIAFFIPFMYPLLDVLDVLCLYFAEITFYVCINIISFNHLTYN